MPVVDTTNFSSQGGSGTDSVSKILDSLLSGNIVAYVVNEAGKPIGTRAMIDDAISEYSRTTGDVSVYNKWIQTDTNLDKAIKKYLMEVENLLVTLNGQAQAKTVIEQQPVDASPQTPPMAGMQQPGSSGLDKQLPTQENKRKREVGPLGKALTDVLSKEQKDNASLEKDLVGIGASEEQAKDLVRNKMYKKGQIYPDVNQTTPYTKSMVDEEAIIEESVRNLDWNTKQSLAKRYTVEQLEFAIKDCIEASQANPDQAGYYHDEASVYRAELMKRNKKKPSIDREAIIEEGLKRGLSFEELNEVLKERGFRK